MHPDDQPHDEQPRRSRRGLLVAGAIALVAIVAVAAVALVVTRRDGGGGGLSGDTIEIVVPPGTQERLDRGEEVVVMPSPLRLHVGDRLLIRNDDVVDQSVGPFLVRAGKEFEFTYGATGTYEGFCPVSEGQRYEIIITD